MNIFQEIIKEICDEKDIKFELLSKDWIIKLSKGNKTRYIVGMRFSINDFANSIICKDKYATYQVLVDAGILIPEHKLIYSKRIKNYKSDLMNKKDIKGYLNECNELVVKDNTRK